MTARKRKGIQRLPGKVRPVGVPTLSTPGGYRIALRRFNLPGRGMSVSFVAVLGYDGHGLPAIVAHRASRLVRDGPRQAAESGAAIIAYRTAVGELLGRVAPMTERVRWPALGDDGVDPDRRRWRKLSTSIGKTSFEMEIFPNDGTLEDAAAEFPVVPRRGDDDLDLARRAFWNVPLPLSVSPEVYERVGGALLSDCRAAISGRPKAKRNNCFTTHCWHSPLSASTRPNSLGD